MKHKSIILIALLALFLAGCGDDGDDGAQGPPGPPGQDGDIIEPTVTNVVPADGEPEASVGILAVAATFSEPMNVLTMDNDFFYLAGRQGDDNVVYDPANNIAYISINPLAPLVVGTQYNAIIEEGILDLSGNALRETKTWTFTVTSVDFKAPIVSVIQSASITPPDIVKNSRFNIVFDEPMDSNTINDQSVILLELDAPNGNVVGNVAGDVSYIGVSAVFTPAEPLASLTNYRLSINNNAEDLAGNTLVESVTDYLTCDCETDGTAPSVADNTPGDGATNVPVTTFIGALFPEYMTPTTITTNTVGVTYNDGTNDIPVSGIVVYDFNPFGPESQAEFIPDAPLLNDTLYTVTVTTGAEDLNQLPLAADVSWSFTTTPAPAFVGSVPDDGAVDIALDAVIVVTFNKDIDDATLVDALVLSDGTNDIPLNAVIYDDVNFTATYTPTDLLTATTDYSWTLAGTVADTDGTALGADVTGSFSTLTP